jgi:ADP-ribosylglycohydrolase
MSSVDHTTRMERAQLSLDGLSVGDAFGERFFGPPADVLARIAARSVPPAPWRYTDDTEMALGILETLGRAGTVDQDHLASVFGRRYLADPRRGYGGTAHEILQALGRGAPWKLVAGAVFDGGGSMGNGGAMRVAPLGAYFADDRERLIEEAGASAAVTHAHPDGQAGAIAVALAASWAWNHRGGNAEPRALLEYALEGTPAGDTRDRIERALALPRETTAPKAAEVLGSGSRVISSDTVPFALWCAARHAFDYREALWATVSGLGDRDTTCAIVGGVVALSTGRDSIPGEWLAAREPLR